MQITSRLRLQLLVQNGIFVVLLIALIALLAFFMHEYRTERDITQNSRNTLSQPTREVLAKLAGPVRITIFAARQDPRGDVRKMIGDFLAPYQRDQQHHENAVLHQQLQPQSGRDLHGLSAQACRVEAANGQNQKQDDQQQQARNRVAVDHSFAERLEILERGQHLG